MFSLNLTPLKFIFSELIFKMLQPITGLPIIKQLFPFQLCKFKTLRKYYPNWNYSIASHLQHPSLLEDTKTEGGKKEVSSLFDVFPLKFCQTMWWMFCSLLNWSESNNFFTGFLPPPIINYFNYKGSVLFVLSFFFNSNLTDSYPHLFKLFRNVH